MKLRRRLFSGSSEASPEGISYHAAQVTSEYVLDPVENVIYKIEESPIGDIKTVKKNTKRVKGVVKPFNDYFKYLKDKRERKIAKKRSKRIKSFSTALEEKLYGRPFLGRSPLIRSRYSHRNIPGVTGMTPELPSHRRSPILLPPIVKKETLSPTIPKPAQQPIPQNKPENNSIVGSGFFGKVKKGGLAIGRGISDTGKAIGSGAVALGRGICETGKVIGVGAAALGTGASLSLLHSKNDKDDE